MTSSYTTNAVPLVLFAIPWRICLHNRKISCQIKLFSTSCTIWGYIVVIKVLTGWDQICQTNRRAPLPLRYSCYDGQQSVPFLESRRWLGFVWYVLAAKTRAAGISDRYDKHKPQVFDKENTIKKKPYVSNDSELVSCRRIDKMATPLLSAGQMGIRKRKIKGNLPVGFRRELPAHSWKKEKWTGELPRQAIRRMIPGRYEKVQMGLWSVKERWRSRYKAKRRCAVIVTLPECKDQEVGFAKRD